MKTVRLGYFLCVVAATTISALALDYTWSGANSTTFSDPLNWDANGVMANSGTFASRLNIQNGANNPFTYSAAQGWTVYSGGANGRALFIANGTAGTMTISGGTFEAQGSGSDGMGNNGAGHLIISGGAYIKTNFTSSTDFQVGFGGTGTGRLTINSGLFMDNYLQVGAGAGGTITLNGGILATKAIRNGGTGRIVFDGGTLQARGGTINFVSGLTSATINAGGAIINSAGFDITIPQAFSGAGSLTKVGAGSLTLSGSNSYAGETTVNAGYLIVQGGTALADAGTVTLANTAGVVFQLNNDETIGSLGGGGGSGGNANLQSYQLTTGGNNANTTFNGIVSGTGSLTKNGSGRLTLNGANTYSGGTTINNGDITVTSTGSLGSGAVNITANSAVLRLDTTTGLIFNNTLTLSGNDMTYGNLRNVSGNNIWAGQINLLVNSTINAFSDTLTISGQISGSGGLAVTSWGVGPGNGVVVLTGANNYTGVTTLTGGTLQLSGGDDRLLNTGSLTFSGGALVVSGLSQTLDRLTVPNGIDALLSGTGSLTINSANNMVVGANNADGSATLDMSGLAAFVYNSPTRTFAVGGQQTSSGTHGANGSVALANTSTITTAVLNLGLVGGGIPGNTTFNTSSLLLGYVTSISANTITAATAKASGTLAFQSGLAANPTVTIRGTTGGSVTTFVLAHDQSTSGLPTEGLIDLVSNVSGTSVLDAQINNLTIGLTTGGNQPARGTFIMGGGTLTVQTMTLAQTSGGTANGTFSMNGGTVAAQTIQKGTGGGTAAFLMNSGTLRNFDASTDLTITGLTVTLGAGPNTILIDTGRNGSFTTGTLSGSGGFTKDGGGTLILNGASDYAGSTTVNAGQLVVGNNTALGSTAGGTAVNSGARLVLANGITVVGETATISGTGGDFNGALQAAAGAAATWNGPVVLGSADVRIGAGIGGTLTVSGAIQGSGANQNLNIGAGDLGAATVILSAASGNNTYTGPTSIIRGTLQLGANDTLPTGTTLDVDSSTANQNSIFDLNGFSQTVGALNRSNAGGAGHSFVTNTSGTAGTLTVNQTINTTYTGTITGNLALTKGGTGTLTLDNANAYTGGTIVNNGFLALGASERLPDTGTVTINGGTLHLAGFTETVGPVTLVSGGITSGTLAGSVYDVQSGQIDASFTGGAALNKSTGGTVVLTATNSYTGLTTITAGLLDLQNGSAISGTSSVTTSGAGGLGLDGGITVSGKTIAIAGNGYNNVGGLQAVSGANTWTGPVTLAANAARLGAAAGATLTVSGVVDDGPSSFDLAVRNATSAGTVVLSGANTYGGDTILYTGTLKLDGGNNRLPTSTVFTMSTGVSGPSVLDLNGFNQQVAGLASGDASRVINNSSPTLSTLTVNTTAASTYNGSIAGNIALAKTGASTLALGGANSYTGATTVTGGMLQLQHGGAVSGTSSISVSGGAIFALDGGITASGGTLIISGAPGDNLGPFRATSGANTWTGPVKLGQDQVRFGALVGATLTVAGAIDSGASNWGPAIRTADVGGTVLFTGANTYLGNTSIVVGRLQLGGADNRLPVGTVLTIGNAANVSSALFDLAGFNQTVAGLQDLGTTMLRAVTNSSPTLATLTVNNTSGYTYDGRIASNVALTKSGAGPLTLTTANTFTGGVTLNAGQLNLNSNTAVGTGTLTINGGTVGNTSAGVTTFSNNNPITINGNFTADTTTHSINFGTGPVSLGTAGGTTRTITVNGNVLTIGGVISDGTTATALTKAGGAVLILGGANTYSGLTTVSAGTLIATDDNSLGSAATGTTVSNGAVLDLRNNITITGEALSITGNGISNGGALRNTSGNNTWIGNITANTASAQTRIVSDGGTLTITGSITTTGSGNLFVLGGDSFGEVSGVISGPAQVFKSSIGGGTWVLSGPNTYSGLTTVASGVVRVANSDGLGTTAGGVTVSSGAALEFTGGITIGNEAATINGTGISNGGAIRNLSGNNSYAGLVTLGSNARINSDAGTLTFDRTAGNAITAANLNLSVGGAGNVAIRDPIAIGTGQFIKDGPGKVLLGGVNTYTGATTINAGELELTGNGDINSSGTVTIDGATLRQNNTSLAFSRTGTQVLAFGPGGGTLSGIGKIDTSALNPGWSLTVSNKVVLAPGNSPGMQNYVGDMVWQNGGKYDWEINDWNGVASNNWDFILLNGDLTLANLTSPNQFTIEITGLGAGDLPANFDNSLGKAFPILFTTVGGGITDFSAYTNWFVLDTSNFGFDQPYAKWTIYQQGDALWLNYTALIPEPTVVMLFGLGGLLLLGGRKLKRGRSGV